MDPNPVLINRKLDSIGDINLRVLNGNIENLSIQGQTEILSALLQNMKCMLGFSHNLFSSHYACAVDQKV